MALPVVTVASGGLPVTDVTSTLKIGLPVTEASNGRGTAVTKVASGGRPVVYAADFSSYVPPVPGPEASAWLARAPGLDAAHANADVAFINGMVAANLWQKMDFLYLPATQNSTIALLNVRQNLYNATAVGSPAFAVDRGFTGVLNSTTVYINTNFNPSAQSATCVFKQNDAHISLWSNTAAVAVGVALGGIIGGATNFTYLAPRGTGDLAGFSLNSSTGPPNNASTDGSGHFVVTRTLPTVQTPYRNGLNMGDLFTNTNPPANVNTVILANNNGSIVSGWPGQVSAASMGSGLTQTDVINFSNLMRTRMTAVGVP